MWTNERLTTDTDYPVSLDEAKTHLRIVDDAEDDYIAGLIAAATVHLENRTNRAFRETEYLFTTQLAPDQRVIYLPVSTVSEISLVEYLDSAEVWQTVDEADYVASLSEPASIILQSYPCQLAGVPNLRITYVAGATDLSVAKVAIKLLVAEWYAHREATITGTIIAPLPVGGVDGLIDALAVRRY